MLVTSRYHKKGYGRAPLLALRGRAASGYTSFQQSFFHFFQKCQKAVPLSRPSHPSRLIKLCVPFFFFLSLFSFLNAQEKSDSINPKIIQFSQQNIDFHNFLPDTFQFNPSELIYWDNADIMIHPYVRTLGQIGKPHEIYQYGTPIPYNNDPFLQQNQLYFWDIEKQSLFLNTRTSFIRAKFNQSGFKTQNLGLILSRNINPFWNITLKSQRRTSVGAYLNNITDHWNIHLTTHYLSKNQRHFWGLASMLHDLKDNLNGGTFQDGTYNYETSFNQNAQPILFRDASWIRKEKSLLTQYSYQLSQDTSLLHGIFQTHVGYQWYKWTLRDEQIDSLLIARSILHNPLGFQTINSLFHEYELEKYFGKIVLILKNARFQNHLSVKAIQNDYKGHLKINQQRNLQIENLTYIRFSSFYMESRQKIQSSNIFSFSNEHYIKATYYNQESLKNWKMSLCIDFQNQNPSLRDRYSNFHYFQSKADLKNFQNQRVYLESRLEKKEWWLEAKAIYQQIYHAIYFNSQAQLVQNSSMWINFGSEIKTRYQWKSYYFEGQYLGYISPKKFIGLTDRMPNHIGAIQLGYRKLHFKNQIELNFEIKNKYIVKTQAYLFEHAGFFWYPYINVEQKSVLISDFFASAKFKKALIFIRLNNLWDKILFPGYYTTYYHPMINRSLNFGILWDFTD